MLCVEGDDLHPLDAVVLRFVTEVFGTVSGFGSSVFFVPLAGMFFDFETTLALTGILHIFSTGAQVFMFQKEIDWPLLLKIGIPRAGLNMATSRSV